MCNFLSCNLHKPTEFIVVLDFPLSARSVPPVIKGASCDVPKVVITVDGSMNTVLHVRYLVSATETA